MAGSYQERSQDGDACLDHSLIFVRGDFDHVCTRWR
jgi:hypothetical protein